jgi:2-succinyl-6-hydroxy-2,4-cyclohexadiene-1-carboxylate synthase
MVNTINILGFPHVYELSAPTAAPTVLVFLHGWLLSRAYWKPVIERLSPDFQCLTYDMRGFGESQLSTAQPPPAIAQTTAVPRPVLEKAAVGAALLKNSASEVEPTAVMPPSPLPLSRYTPAAYAQDLNLLLQQLGISRAWLIGHSLGGSIALWAADQAPETIAGVICVNAGGGIYLKEEFEQFRTIGQQLVSFRPRWFSHIPFLDRALTRFNVARSIDRQWGRQRLLDLLNAQPEAALGTLLDSTTEAEVHLLPQVVSRLSQPVHFIAGANDKVMEPKYVHHLASYHTSFESCGNNVSEIPNCGHLAMVEQPEAVAHEIRTVLTKHIDEFR